MEATRHSDVEAQLDELLKAAQPGSFGVQVSLLARWLVTNGYSREELLEAFEHFREQLQSRDLEEHEDELLDVMDQLEGWCSPHSRI